MHVGVGESAVRRGSESIDSRIAGKRTTANQNVPSIEGAGRGVARSIGAAGIGQNAGRWCIHTCACIIEPPDPDEQRLRNGQKRSGLVFGGG